MLGYSEAAAKAVMDALTRLQEGLTDSGVPEAIVTRFSKKLPLRYGQNPGYPAAFYIELGASGPNMSCFELMQEGRGLGFINIGDMDLGQQVVKKLYDAFITAYEGRPVCAVIKHEMPSGVGMGGSANEAFERAWYCDSLSAFGGVDVFTCEVDGEVAKSLAEPARNVEVVYAPSFTPAALDTLKGRKELRVVKMADIALPSIDGGLNQKSLAGGLLLENRYDTKITGPDCVDCVSERKPTASEVAAAIFNWIVAGFTRSNAVVLGTEEKTHGIGSGQMSRIDSAYIATWKANGRNGRVGDSYGARGTVMASDAFMPATDVVELAAEEGVTAIIYPLGSVKDQDVLEVANKHRMAMLITRKPGETAGGERCFLHR